jgi:hypothetical protein
MENTISRNVWRNLINCHLSIVTFTVYFFIKEPQHLNLHPKESWQHVHF